MDSPFFTLSIPYRLSVWQYDTPLSTKMNRIRSVFAEMCCLLLAFVAFWKSGGPFLGEPGLRAGLDEKGVRSLQPEQSFKQMRLLPLRPLQRGTLIFALRKLIEASSFKVSNKFGFRLHSAFTSLLNRPGHIYS